jgi:hypothetical protein
MNALNDSRLTIDNSTISVDDTGANKKALAEAKKLFQGLLKLEGGVAHENWSISANRITRILDAAERSGLGLAPLSGSLHKALHKALHKSLHKGLQKRTSGGEGEGQSSAGFSWPEIDIPWKEMAKLHDLRKVYQWDLLPLPPPQPEAKRLAETGVLLKRQKDLLGPNEAMRRQRIVTESGNDLTAYMLPLGADVTAGSDATAILFQMIIWVGGVIGQHYKSRFMAERPSVLEPRLRPFLPVPAFSSYPSNHALQSFLMAEIFARAVPEHPGVSALFRAAREVSENREWAGLHVASDTEAGRKLARLVAPVMEEVLEDQIANVRKEWY